MVTEQKDQIKALFLVIINYMNGNSTQIFNEENYIHILNIEQYIIQYNYFVYYK